MTAVRQILWKVLTVGMIPFILGAGLPQMQCQCAAAKGQRWCECCFRKPDDSTNSALKPCCRRHLAKQVVSGACERESSGCPTCPQFRNPKTGSCCSVKQSETPTLAKPIAVSEFDVAVLCLPLIVCDWHVPASPPTSREAVWSRDGCVILPIDRVIVFERLVI